MPNDKRINAEIHKLRQSHKNGIIDGACFYDLKHALLMSLKEPPPSALLHEDTKVRVGSLDYYRDEKGGMFHPSPNGRIYL